jgi:hypothetical protein
VRRRFRFSSWRTEWRLACEHLVYLPRLAEAVPDIDFRATLMRGTNGRSWPIPPVEHRRSDGRNRGVATVASVKLIGSKGSIEVFCIDGFATQSSSFRLVEFRYGHLTRWLASHPSFHPSSWLRLGETWRTAVTCRNRTCIVAQAAFGTASDVPAH